MATQPTDHSSFISTCNRILATKEQLIDQSAKGLECLDRLLGLKLSHPDIFSEEVEAKLKAVKRESDEKKIEMIDEINETRQMLSELSPDHFQKFGGHFDSLQIEEQLNRSGQEIHEWNDELHAFVREVEVKYSQIKELEKIRSDNKDVATQADTKVEKTFISSGN